MPARITKNEALKRLNRDIIRNINMINFINNYQVDDLIANGDAILARGVSDRPWVYISAKDVDELNVLIPLLNDKDCNFAVAEPWMVPYLTQGRHLLWDMPIMKLYLPHSVSLPQLEDIEGLTSLERTDAVHVYENSDYQEYLTIPYIQERIKNGANACLRKDGRLVAWAMTHDDGAIGFLHVMPEERKNGYGMTVTVALINILRENGALPFVHIEEKNSKSMHLAKKLGFVEDRIITWFSME